MEIYAEREQTRGTKRNLCIKYTFLINDIFQCKLCVVIFIKGVRVLGLSSIRIIEYLDSGIL